MAAGEVALFSLSRFQLKTLKDRFKGPYRKIKRLLDDPGGVLLSILLLNEMLNIAATSLIAHGIFRDWNTSSWNWLQRLRLYFFPSIPDWFLQALVAVSVSTPLLLFLCELTPKSIAARANQMIAPMTVGLLTTAYDFLKPIRKILAFVLRAKSDTSHPLSEHPETLKEDELLTLVEEGRKEGDIRINEVGLIRNVLELDDVPVLEIMTPLHKTFCLENKTTIQGAIQAMQSGLHSRVPIWAEKKHQIVGVLYARDLLIARLDPKRAEDPVQSLMRKPLRFGSHTRLDVLFKKIKQQQVHLALIENNSGQTIGIVTLTDILDAIFEDLIDPDAPAVEKTT
mgnify:CR=1 FL=1